MAMKKAMPTMTDAPMMPSVHLDHDALKGMGMHTGRMPSPGDKLPLSATAHVKSVGESDSGRHMMVELHDMAVKGGTPNDNDGDEAKAKGAKGAMDKALATGSENGKKAARK